MTPMWSLILTVCLYCSATANLGWAQLRLRRQAGSYKLNIVTDNWSRLAKYVVYMMGASVNPAFTPRPIAASTAIFWSSYYAKL